MNFFRSIHLSTWLILSTSIGLIVCLFFRLPLSPPLPFVERPPSDTFLAKRSSSLPSPVLFEDQTLSKGLNFIHQQGDERLSGVDESLGSGACAFDYDNDGWTDLFLVNGSGQTRFYGKPYWWQSSQESTLFRNVEGGRFENVTAMAGLSGKLWGMGCLSGDFDNDGDADLLVTGRDKNYFYNNNGDGTFRDITEESGIKGGFWSTSAAAADFNGDGLLDFYLGNFIDFKKGIRTFEANSQFSSEKQNTFIPSLYEPQPNQLYLNLGGMKFRDIAVEAGVGDAEGRTLDVAWLDADENGMPDLIVSNERGTGSNVVFLNRGTSHFVVGGIGLGLGSALGSRGIAVGDLNNDGAADVVLASASGENTVALLQETAGSPDARYRYADRAREMGIGVSAFLSLSGWTPGIHDFNNDGFNDVFLASGQLNPDGDTPRVPLGQGKQLLLNRGDGQFTDVSDASGVAMQDKQSARGAVFADFDNDGDTDVYVAHNNDLGQLLINQSGKRHWLGLRLIGHESNRDAFGAVVTLETAHGRQTRFVASGEGFLSDSERRLLFGLGDQTDVRQVSVRWPSGARQTFARVVADRYLIVEEGQSELREMPVKLYASKRALRLKLGADDPGLRARYVGLITAQNDFDAASELEAASADADSGVRRAVIRAATEKKSQQGLRWLVKALDDPAPENAVAAIEGLRQYEDETSVRWLLRQFKRSDVEVKVKLAECFEFFFREEEAVVHRKYLAVPYLIRLLDDAQPPVRKAAARALAEAERYQGLHSLLSHLDDPDPSVRSEVVRTLGLIRQRYAVPELRRVAADVNQPAEVVANALIALKRLDAAGIAETLKDFSLGQGEYAAWAIGRRLAVIDALINRESDFAAFDSKQFSASFREIPYENREFSGNREVLLHWIGVRSRLGDETSRRTLERLSKDVRPEIRLAAYKALLIQVDGDKAKITQQAWQDRDPAVRRWAIAELLKSKVTLSADDYRTLLDRRDDLNAMLRNGAEAGLSDGNASRLLERLLAKRSAVGGEAEFSDADLEKVCGDPDPLGRRLCVATLFAKATPRNCALIAKILRDQTGQVEFRMEVLERYGIDFDPEAVNVLFALSENKKDPLRDTAIGRLFRIDSGSLLQYARRIAEDRLEKNAVRFDAVEYLLRQGDRLAYKVLFDSKGSTVSG